MSELPKQILEEDFARAMLPAVPYDASRHDQSDIHEKCVVSGFVGIVMAGFLYPFSMAILILVWQFLWVGDVVPADLLSACFYLGVFSLIGGCIGFILSAVTGLLSMLLVIVINRSLGNPLAPRSAAISAGSLAGYIPTAWVVFSPEFGGTLAESAMVALMGPILAMSLGAIGAARTSRKFANPNALGFNPPEKHQLSIIHLLIGTSWIAVVFALSNVFGGQGFTIAVVMWFALQTAMLVGIWMYRKLRPRQFNQQNETGIRYLE